MIKSSLIQIKRLLSNVSLRLLLRTNSFEIFFFGNLNDIDKIFVQNIVIIKFRSKEQHIVLVVVFLNIVATFFDDNYIAYLRFKKLLNFDNISLYNIKKDSQRKKLLKETCLIF